jgi:hypothetical protein
MRRINTEHLEGCAAAPAVVQVPGAVRRSSLVCHIMDVSLAPIKDFRFLAWGCLSRFSVSAGRDASDPDTTHSQNVLTIIINIIFNRIIMLIKVYNQPKEDAPTGYLRLYENVSDVVVHESLYGPGQTGPDHVFPSPTTHISADPADTTCLVKFVDFTQNGVRHRLSVAPTSATTRAGRSRRCQRSD